MTMRHMPSCDDVIDNVAEMTVVPSSVVQLSFSEWNSIESIEFVEDYF